MPAKPRWLLAVPDAIAQLRALDRETITRPDMENLFAVSRARAWQLLRRFGATRTVNLLTIDRHALIAALEKVESGEGFQAEVQRQQGLYRTLRQARAGSIRVRITEPQNAGCATIKGLPDGVRLEPGRIEVQFEGAHQGIERLYALAKALMNDYDRFETLVAPKEGRQA